MDRFPPHGFFSNTFEANPNDNNHPPSFPDFSMTNQTRENIEPPSKRQGTCLPPNPQPNNVRYYKTRPCTAFTQGHPCSYGENCTYAHGQHEIRPQQQNWQVSTMPSRFVGRDCNVYGKKSAQWKTKLCHKYRDTGFCQYGGDCLFAHGVEELRMPEGNVVLENGKNVEEAPSKALPEQALSAFLTQTQATHVKGEQCQDKTSLELRDPAQSNDLFAFPDNAPSTFVYRKLLKWKWPKKLIGLYADWI